MKRHLFKFTSIRLAGTYLSVLMALSFIFSVAIFRLSGNEFDRNFNRANNFAEQFVGFRLQPEARQGYLDDRALERDQGKSHIVSQLVFLNLVILFLGGGVCYVLARRTLEPIEEAHTSLERFTSDAAHELRTPLTSMRTEIEVAMMKNKLTIKEATDLLKSNLEEVNRLTELSDRLLGLARGDSGALALEKVTIADVVLKAVETVKPRAKAKQITIEVIKPKTAQVSVMGDMSSLTEAVIILLDNAIKYSKTNANVSVKVGTLHSRVMVAVADKGIGITAHEIDHIFKRFYRSDTSRTKDTTHGYGLGLPLAEKIIQQHDGVIEVKSTPSKGSTFTILLPIA